MLCVFCNKKNEIRTFSNIKILYVYKIYATIILHSEKSPLLWGKGVKSMWYPWTHPLFLGIWSNVFPGVLQDCTVANQSWNSIAEANQSHRNSLSSFRQNKELVLSILFAQSPNLGFSWLASKIIQIIKSGNINIVSLIHWESKVEATPHFFSLYKVLLINIWHDVCGIDFFCR